MTDCVAVRRMIFCGRGVRRRLLRTAPALNGPTARDEGARPASTKRGRCWWRRIQASNVLSPESCTGFSRPRTRASLNEERRTKNKELTEIGQTSSFFVLRSLFSALCALFFVQVGVLNNLLERTCASSHRCRKHEHRSGRFPRPG